MQCTCSTSYVLAIGASPESREDDAGCGRGWGGELASCLPLGCSASKSWASMCAAQPQGCLDSSVGLAVPLHSMESIDHEATRRRATPSFRALCRDFPSIAVIGLDLSRHLSIRLSSRRNAQVCERCFAQATVRNSSVVTQQHPHLVSIIRTVIACKGAPCVVSRTATIAFALHCASSRDTVPKLIGLAGGEKRRVVLQEALSWRSTPEAGYDRWSGACLARANFICARARFSTDVAHGTAM